MLLLALCLSDAAAAGLFPTEPDALLPEPVP
jgi:hypothetical protein